METVAVVTTVLIVAGAVLVLILLLLLAWQVASLRSCVRALTAKARLLRKRHDEDRAKLIRVFRRREERLAGRLNEVVDAFDQHLALDPDYVARKQ